MYYKACRDVLASTTLYYRICKNILPSTTLYYKACRNILAGTTLYYKACRNVIPSTTLYYKAFRNVLAGTTLYFKACRNVLASITLYYKACRNVLASTTLYYRACRNVLPSTTLYYKACRKVLPSTTLYYKACRNLLPSTTLYYRACRNVLASTSLYFKACRNVLSSTTLYYKACRTVLPSTTLYYKSCRKWEHRFTKYCACHEKWQSEASWNQHEMASSNAIYDLLGKHARPKSKHSPHENQNHNVGIQRYDPFLATVSHKSGNHNVGTRFKIEYNILFLAASNVTISTFVPHLPRKTSITLEPNVTISAFVPRLPRKLGPEAHQILRLPRKEQLGAYQILRLPRKLGPEVHQILRLPRKMELGVYQILRPPREVGPEVHQILRLPREMHLRAYQILRPPRKLGPEVHQILRLPRKVELGVYQNWLYGFQTLFISKKLVNGRFWLQHMFACNESLIGGKLESKIDCKISNMNETGCLCHTYGWFLHTCTHLTSFRICFVAAFSCCFKTCLSARKPGSWSGTAARTGTAAPSGLPSAPLPAALSSFAVSDMLTELRSSNICESEKGCGKECVHKSNAVLGLQHKWGWFESPKNGHTWSFNMMDPCSAAINAHTHTTVPQLAHANSHLSFSCPASLSTICWTAAF